MHGREAARGFLEPIVRGITTIQFILKAIVVNQAGEAVLTERLDRLHYGDKTVDIPLMGIFEVRGGLITGWRDYTDTGSIREQFAKLRA